MLLLLACSEPPAPLPPPPAPVDAPTEPGPAPGATAGGEAPAPPAEPRVLTLDATGGGHGAPAGTNFILPAGVTATATAGKLSNGGQGFTLRVDKPGDALVCTQAVEAGMSFGFRARLKAEVKPGAQAWHGLNVELRARDASGALVSPPGSRYVLLGNVRASADWGDLEGTGAMPAGATRAELCFHFVESTGVLEVDELQLLGVGGGADTGVRWELDTPGGEGGAPSGAAFFLPQGAAGVKTEVGDLGGGKGYRLEVQQEANALACSQPFPLQPKMEGRARLRVKEVKSKGGAYRGLTFEVRSYDAAGTLVAAPGSQYIPLKVWAAPTDWVEVATPFDAAPGATVGKLCTRFVEATGAVDVDWLGVGAL